MWPKFGTDDVIMTSYVVFKIRLLLIRIGRRTLISKCRILPGLILDDLNLVLIIWY